MENCSHIGEHGKYCSQCAKAINIAAREPGEIKRMRGVLKSYIDGLKENSNSQSAVLALVSYIFMDATLQWTLGELSEESFLKLLVSNSK